jgi:hypothetical protein
MKIELSSGVVVIPTPEIATRVKQIIFEEIDNCPACPEEEKQAGGGALKAETKLSAKFRRKFEQPSAPRKIQKGGYTPEEEANIIKMYNLGHGAGEIGRKVGNRSAATMNAKINYMIVKGQMQKRPKLSMHQEVISGQASEEDEDGFKTL